MRRNWVLVPIGGLAAAVFCIAATGPRALAQGARDADETFDGAYVYNVRCASCHGATGEGIYAFGVPLKGDAFVTSAPPAAIIEVIQNGRYNRARAYPAYPGMPAFIYIRAGEAQALVRYLKGELQSGGPAKGPAVGGLP